MPSFQFLIRSLNKENNHLSWAWAAIWSTTLWNKVKLQLALRDSSHKTDNSVIIYSPMYQWNAFLSYGREKEIFWKCIGAFFVHTMKVGSRLVWDSIDFHCLTRQSLQYLLLREEQSHTGLRRNEGEQIKTEFTSLLLVTPDLMVHLQ